VARRIFLLLLFTVALLLGIGFGSMHWLNSQLQPINPQAKTLVLVHIPAGASMASISRSLFDAHLIRDATFFRYYARYRKLDLQVKPGDYHLGQDLSPDQILVKLSKGIDAAFRFTVPEGLTLEQMGDLLESKHVVDKVPFMAAAAASKLADPYLPPNVHLEYPLEGYLFPDTYEYKPGITANEVIAIMFHRWEQVFTPALRARAQEVGFTIHEVVTLAAIVEKEAQVDKERSIIAGVYVNRLKINMKLDADPAVRYALKKQPLDPLHVSDLSVDSPYNSYKYGGLPPGPIASPGAASIKAALNPEKNDLWYFVAKADGSGEHYFAKTLAEQDANIAKSLANENK
jgi:UPF0755 protein